MPKIDRNSRESFRKSEKICRKFQKIGQNFKNRTKFQKSEKISKIGQNFKKSDKI